jgi:hypothetical protein
MICAVGHNDKSTGRCHLASRPSLPPSDSLSQEAGSIDGGDALAHGVRETSHCLPKPTIKLEVNNRHDWLIVTIKLELGGDRTDGCEHPQTAHTRIG